MSNPILLVTLALDPQEMARRGRLGGQRTAQLHDSHKLTSTSRAAFDARFEIEADPDGTLPIEERRRRVAALRRAYFSWLGKRSAMARRARKAGGVTAS